MITVISAIGDDDMVEEIDAHQIAGILNELRNTVVFRTGRVVVAGMIVAKCNNGGVV